MIKKRQDLAVTQSLISQLMEVTHVFTLILPFQHKVLTETRWEGYSHVLCVCVCMCFTEGVSYCAEDVSNLETAMSRVEMIREEEIGGLELSA